MIGASDSGRGALTAGLSAAVNAAPFVPTTGAAPSAPPGTADAAAAPAASTPGAPNLQAAKPSKLTLSAAPFVPSSGPSPQTHALRASPASKTTTPKERSAAISAAAAAQQHKMSAAASAFVPKGEAAPAAEGGAPKQSQAQPQPQLQAQPQPHHAASSGRPVTQLRSPGKGRSSGGASGGGAGATAAAAAAAGASGYNTGTSAGGARGRGRARNSSGGGGGGGPPGLPPSLGPDYSGRHGYWQPGLAAPGAFNGLGSGPGAKRNLGAGWGPVSPGGYSTSGGGGGGYSGSASSAHAGRGKALLAAQFMGAGLRQQLQQRNFLEQAQWVTGAEELVLPDKVGVHHTLYPLEEWAPDAGDAPSEALGVRSMCLKAISALDGRTYALRVVDGKQVIPTSELLAAARHAVDAWEPLAGHPGLCAPRGAFVSSELEGVASLVLAHDFLPGACSVAQAHMAPAQTASGQLVTNTPSEELLWSYLVQLCAALRAAHAAGLAVRAPSLHPTKVLLLPTGRVRIGALGVADVLLGAPSGREELLAAQRDDLVALGQLMLSLAALVGGPAAAVAPSLDFAASQYSPELVRVLAMLLSANEPGAARSGAGGFSWRHLWALMGEHTMAELDVLGAFNEQLVHDLTRECENGRLLRLLVKLGFVVDRPEGDAMSQWSETGDRYLIRLFRDHMFHQCTDTGQPRLDWGHVVEALNKLDAGVDEQLLLLSRDETSMLVVSYADVKRCIEASYAELKATSVAVRGGLR